MSHSSRPLVAVTIEQRLLSAEKRLWAPSPFAHDYWASFLGVPTDTIVIARSESARRIPDGYAPVDGPHVEPLPLPPLRPGIRLLPEMGSALLRLSRLEKRPPLVLRMPGVVSSLALVVAVAHHWPFAVQVVGDPIGVTFAAKVGGPAGRMAGAVLAGTTAMGCRKAAVVSYVTKQYLQRRYSPGPRTITYAISDVQLPDSLPQHSRILDSNEVEITTVASMDQTYKRLDLLLDAVAILIQEGWQVKLNIVGEGRLANAYVSRAEAQGIEGKTRFHGLLPQAEVFQVIASSHLFVLCSDTEGMPRAMIEAMAIGTPCIGSAVGGITELLPAHALFERGSLPSLLAALRRHLVSPALFLRTHEEVQKRAIPFEYHTLQPLRERFARDVFLTSGAQAAESTAE